MRFCKRDGEEEGFSGSVAWKRHAAFFPQCSEREAALCSRILC